MLNFCVFGQYRPKCKNTTFFGYMHKKNATALTSGSGSLTYYWAKVEKKRKSYKKIPTTARVMGKGRF